MTAVFDPLPLLESLSSRRRQLRMRLILAVLVAILFGDQVGWPVAAVWLSLYGGLQLAEVQLAGAFKRAPSAALSWTALGVLTACGLVFGAITVVGGFTQGAWGMLNGSFLIAGAILNGVMSSRRSPGILFTALAPYVFYLLLFPLLALHNGAPPTMAVSVLVAGALIVLPAVLMWREGVRLREGEESAQRLRIEAEEASSAKTAFLATMSHEIRTPLNGVMAFSSALAHTELTPVQAEMLEVVQSTAASLDRLLGDILDVSRIEAGRLELINEFGDLEEIVATTVALFQPAAREKGLELTAEIRGREARGFWGDGPRIRQILTNLISNAVKFTEAGSVRVEASLQRSGEDTLVGLTVADTGPGFDPADKARLFAAFEQGDGSSRRRHGGMGLGLSITRSLAEAMGGTLEAESRPGAGSTFTVTLRLPSSTAEPPAQDAGRTRPKAEIMRHHAPVLVAEDDANNRRAMELMLSIIGVEAVCVADGAQALEAVRTGSFELVLMDIRMPGMDGLDSIRAIRAWEAERRLPRTTIHVLSAQAFERDIQAAMAAGADGYFTKPISAPQVHDLVRRALAMETPAEVPAQTRGAA